MLNQKGFAPIFLLGVMVIVVVVTGGGYYLLKVLPANNQPTSDSRQTQSPSPFLTEEMSNWKTYKNDVFGIAFQYPSNYQKQEGGGGLTILSPNLNYSYEASDNPDSLSISVGFQSDGYKSFEELKASYKDAVGYAVTERVIGGLKALYSVSDDQGERYEFLKNGYTFYILKHPRFTSRKEEFDKIISSFRFYQPTEIFQSEAVNLKTAWQAGTKIYRHSNLGITIEYPKSLEISAPSIENGEFSLGLVTPEVPIEKRQRPEFDFVADNNNTMRISIEQYPNKDNVSLYDFIAKTKKSYPGDGITETFDTYRKNLNQTNVPKEGSYVFIGIIGENPRKEVYFENKGNFYVFGLGGGNDTGHGYSEDADKLFENILKSIKFL